MSYLEELLPEFRKGAKIRRKIWANKEIFVEINEAGEPVLNNGNKFEFCRNITCSDWELYQDPEPDWQYIIDNKCPCLFWNSEDDAKIDFLTDVNDNIHSFVSRHSGFIHCRPVRRDEITFYEDKEDDRA